MKNLQSFEEYTNESFKSFNNKHGTKINIAALLSIMGVNMALRAKGDMDPIESLLHLGLIAASGFAVGINLLKMKNDKQFMDLVKNMNLSEDEVYEILDKIQRDPISKKMVDDIKNSSGADKEKNIKQYKKYLMQTYKIK